MSNKKLFILFFILLIVLLSIPACNSSQEENSNQEIDSKLDFNIKRLIEAEERGEAEEFAEPRGIELINGSVTVIIECEPGQAEAIAEAAIGVGDEQVRVRSQNNWVKAVVPIFKLTALADIPGVHLVRLPWVPSEETGPVNSEGVALINADAWHAYGYDGTGVNVGF